VITRRGVIGETSLNYGMRAANRVSDARHPNSPKNKSIVIGFIPKIQTIYSHFPKTFPLKNAPLATDFHIHPDAKLPVLVG
jgi:hypothetical protein